MPGRCVHVHHRRRCCCAAAAAAAVAGAPACCLLVAPCLACHCNMQGSWCRVSPECCGAAGPRQGQRRPRPRRPRSQESTPAAEPGEPRLSRRLSPTFGVSCGGCGTARAATERPGGSSKPSPLVSPASVGSAGEHMLVEKCKNSHPASRGLTRAAAGGPTTAIRPRTSRWSRTTANGRGTPVSASRSPPCASELLELPARSGANRQYTGRPVNETVEAEAGPFQAWEQDSAGPVPPPAAHDRHVGSTTAVHRHTSPPPRPLRRIRHILRRFDPPSGVPQAFHSVSTNTAPWQPRSPVPSSSSSAAFSLGNT